MNENEVEIKQDGEIITVNVDEVPVIISSQIDAISELEEKIKSSDNSAKNAMAYVNSDMKRYQLKGKGIFKHRAGNTIDIVEDSQAAVKKLAEAQKVSVEAMKHSFEFQKKLAQVSKYLFELGCANITVNRIAVRSIEAKLTGASAEKISELAKQEMMAVVRQLKEQEDILKKQEDLKNKIKESKESISDITNRLQAKDVLDDQQTKQIESLNSAMENIDRIDAEQSQRIEELGALLNNKDLIDQKQDQAISENTEAIKLIYDYINQKDELDQKQSAEIENIALNGNGRKISIVAIVISSIALVGVIFDLLLNLF